MKATTPTTRLTLEHFIRTTRKTLGPEREEPWVLGVLAVENLYRGRLRRAAEYLAWPLLFLFAPQRAALLSVGIAQIQIRHWLRLGFIPSHAPSVAAYRSFFSLAANYDATLAYLRSSLSLREWTAQRIAACYVGEARAHHVRLLGEAYQVASAAIGLEESARSSVASVGRSDDLDDDRDLSRLGYLGELEKLDQMLRAAMAVSQSAGGIQTSGRNVRATKVFTRIVVTAYTFVRLMPGNPITRDLEEFWDWPSIAAVARNVIEAYLVFFFVGVEDISDSEADFRFKLLNFHANSEKYRLFKSGPTPIDLSDFEEGLPKERERLHSHPFFGSLSRDQQKRALSGRSLMYLTRDELMARLPMETADLSWFYRHFSNEVHATPFAFSSQSNERGRGDENDAERGYIIFASRQVRRYLSAAILGLAQILPEVAERCASDVDFARQQQPGP